MKKLLFSLFAFAAIVACEKDAFDDNVMPEGIAPIEAEVESIDASMLKDILNGIGFTGDLQDVENDKQSGLTARNTGGTCSDDRPDVATGHTAIDFQFLPIAGTQQGYFIIRGGGDIPLDINRPIVRFLIPTTGDVSLQLLNGGATIPLGTTPSNPAFAIFAADNFLSIDKTDLYLDSVTPNVEETAEMAGISCGVDLTTFYQVAPAPAPLTGFLARMLSGYDQVTGWPGGTSLNYAATTEAAVRAAIEADINDGN